jgi:hypothetical protein
MVIAFAFAKSWKSRKSLSVYHWSSPRANPESAGLSVFRRKPAYFVFPKVIVQLTDHGHALFKWRLTGGVGGTAKEVIVIQMKMESI